ncbi:hypothetical protein BH23BAC3_BH23BAC3_18480 [soil metagenome]
MKTITQNTLFKQVARLIIAGTVFIIFFGNGVHIHSIFDHLFDHGHIHVILHTHPSDDNHSETGLANLDAEDHHQHPIASIDLSATLNQSANKKEIPESNIFALAIPEQINSILNDSPPAQLAQPPPDLKLTQYHFFFFSLRAPPVA